MTEPTEGAGALLALEQVGENRFRSTCSQDNMMGMMFGGQLLAQGIAAAARTVDGGAVHHCNTCFLSAGNLMDPVEYGVEILRDGRRFAARRVSAVQRDRLLLDMQCSFHDGGGNLRHQSATAPSVPLPESVATEADFVRANAAHLPELVVTAFTGGALPAGRGEDFFRG